MKKHMALIHEEDLPKPEEKLEILKMSIEKLTSAGYEFIGMDHYLAKPDDELSVAMREKKPLQKFLGIQHKCRCYLMLLELHQSVS